MVFPPARCSARAAVDATLFGAAAVARNHESDVGEQPLGHGFCTMGSTFLLSIKCSSTFFMLVEFCTKNI